MYARRGMVPRIPVWRLFGEVRRWSALPPLPASLEAVPFERGRGRAARTGTGASRTAVDGIDRALIGAAHPADHAYLRREDRSGYLVREPRRPAGSTATSTGPRGGRLGPVAADDPALHPALLGVAVRETPMLGAVAIWVPGTADLATRALLDAGLRYRRVPRAHLLVAPRTTRSSATSRSRSRSCRSLPARTIAARMLASGERGSLERALGRSRHRVPPPSLRMTLDRSPARRRADRPR